MVEIQDTETPNFKGEEHLQVTSFGEKEATKNFCLHIYIHQKVYSDHQGRDGYINS